MEKHKNMKLLSIMITILFLVACTTSKKNSEVISQEPANAIEVTVIDYRELDGCTFMLQLADGKKLQPLNLPEQYMKAGVRLMITYKIVDAMGICMAGQMVELNYIMEKTDRKE